MALLELDGARHGEDRGGKSSGGDEEARPRLERRQHAEAGVSQELCECGHGTLGGTEHRHRDGDCAEHHLGILGILGVAVRRCGCGGCVRSRRSRGDDEGVADVRARLKFRPGGFGRSFDEVEDALGEGEIFHLQVVRRTARSVEVCVF